MHRLLSLIAGLTLAAGTAAAQIPPPATGYSVSPPPAYGVQPTPAPGYAVPPPGAPPSSRSRGDRSFLDQGARRNAAEIELGRIAMDLGGSEAVHQYGRMMVLDHSRANDRLMAIAQTFGPLPSTAPDRGEIELHQRLAGEQGWPFDRDYIHAIVGDHQGLIVLFRDEAEHGGAPVLRRYATETLPMLRDHLAEAQRIEARLGPPAVGSRY